MNNTVDPATSLDNGTTTGETLAAEPTSAGGLQPGWLVIVIPFVIIIGLAIIGVAVFLMLRKRRKRLLRGSRHSYPGAHERGRGRTGSTIDLPTSAAPMGEGLNELGEAPPPYPSPEDDDVPRDNVSGAIPEMQSAAGESSGSSSSTSDPSSSSPPEQTGEPSTTTPEMRQSTGSQPPAYDAVMNQRVVSLLAPPTAVAGVTVAAGHA